MRFSLLIKLALGFIIILGIGLLPPYFYSYLFRDQVWKELKQNLALRMQTVAKQLAQFSTKEQQVNELPKLAAISGARITLFFLDNQTWEDSTQTSQPDHQSTKKEFQEALQNPKASGSEIRNNSFGEMNLYIAQFQMIGRPVLIRLSQPVGDFWIQIKKQQMVERVSLGVSYSLALLFFAGFAVHVIRPMNRLKQQLQDILEGNYSFSYFKKRRDELGELQTNVKKLARSLQQEVLIRNMEDALVTELVRVLPFPLALLNTNFGLKQVNPTFREIAHIDPATEHARFHIFCKMNEFIEACSQGSISRTPQNITIRLPWMRRKLSFQICPLPTQKGEVEWAVIVVDTHAVSTNSERDFSQVIQQSIEILKKLSQRDPSEYIENPITLTARFTELRILSDLASIIRTEELSPTNVSIDFTLLLNVIYLEMKPLIDESNLTFSINQAEGKVEIIENQKRVEYVLRAAILRAISSVKTSQDDPILLTLVEVTETIVTCSFVGLPQSVPCEDLDRILAPIGGSVGPLSKEEPSSSLLPSIPIQGGGAELWIKLRRA